MNEEDLSLYFCVLHGKVYIKEEWHPLGQLTPAVVALRKYFRKEVIVVRERRWKLRPRRCRTRN